MTHDKIIQHLTETNTYEYNLLKTVEELTELSTALIQSLVKKKAPINQEIIDEIGDCKIRLEILEKLFDQDKINQRVEYKISKFKEYLEKGKYKNGI
jgi:hypothetical protein